MRRALHAGGLAFLALGLVALYLGLTDGVPLVFWGTDVERESRAAGRELIGYAALELAVAGAGLWIAARRVAAVLAGATGVATAALTFALPEAAYAWFAFLALGFASVVAALSGVGRQAARGAG